ncbi:MAG: DUF423 domain-containing protein [Gammaproteobacteria bacterium]|nr:DUF423 domain-containing protein [Gammaproteobacteria bacterium]
MAKTFLILGGFNAALAVLFGAFGAHALKARLPADMLAIYQTGIHYHLFHSLGLIAVGLVAMQIPASAYLKGAGWLMLAGVVLFCGSLYILSLSGQRWLGMVTPFGGISFILSWTLFVIALFKASS